MPLLRPLFLLSLLRAAATSGVTIYDQIGQVTLAATGTQSAAAPAVTTAAAYNTTVLNPPPVPNPPPATAFTLELQAQASAVDGLSIPIPGTFFGFSVEMSVITQLCAFFCGGRDCGAPILTLGSWEKLVRVSSRAVIRRSHKSSSFVQVPLLNLLSNIRERAGAVNIRIGGNTQEFAYYVDTLPDGHAISKEKADTNNPTQTPAVIYTVDLFYLMANISSFTNVHWYIGVPFNDTSDFRFQIVEYSEAILGDYLLGVQVGNEPDLYTTHQHRTKPYDASNYTIEFGELNLLIGPSVSGTWSPEDVWDTGFITDYADSLYALSVEHYPTDNCQPIYNISIYHDPQLEFPNFLNHTSGVALCEPYLNSTAIAQQAEKPFLMFETNSASCGGFPGISDSFGAALWALDYGLQMAYSNFSGAMLHVGGQDVFYNPFTAPPTNQSMLFEWTIGAVYYSALVAAEVFGKTNTSRIIDLLGNDADIYTPQYAIYENGALARIALFNYVTDPTGATDYTATITVNGGTVPSSVTVKYLLSDSVSTKNNITWAGQTFGTVHEVDGRLKNDLNVVTINCDTSANTCAIPVPAPGFALVFLTQEESIETVTYPTTAHTNTKNTVTVASAVLATSNGMSGSDWELGSTSSGSKTSAARRTMAPQLGWSLGLMGLLLAWTLSGTM
ncbi:hypothetical protein HMN09_00907000 [Mycena chlorophos]|uniref:Beta-glucuronidase C-terminal domain-containing protein n=1 Tax=Mycena chlorophos TaxID=658473 RepID=A0A8H6SNP5_MYCCL|nr:hypothetical protein HMN09_00907000 [Mycena chlorophos]